MGAAFIDTLAKDLKIEFPTLEGMSARKLRYMQIFATEFEQDEFLQHRVAKSPRSSITTLLLELGNGFTFVGRQYHLEIENEDYYIDLLFYNLKVRSYVVIELKTTESKPEYVGKLNFYLSAVDKHIKDKCDNPTFGILLCKGKKKVTAELALRDITKPIGISEYKILSEIPDFLENTLPTIEDIEKRLEENSKDN